MKNFLKTVFSQGMKYRSLISIFVLGILSNASTAKGLGLDNLLSLITNGGAEMRMQSFYYRSIKTQSANNTIPVIDSSVVATDGVTNLMNGYLPQKDSIFGVGAIAIRFGTGATAGVTTFSNAMYDAAAALRIPVGLQNADIEIKCGSTIVLERQTLRKFFAERNINANAISENTFGDALELIEPAYLVGGQLITATITMPNGATALAATANLEIEFYGVGTANK